MQGVGRDRRELDPRLASLTKRCVCLDLAREGVSFDDRLPVLLLLDTLDPNACRLQDGLLRDRRVILLGLCRRLFLLFRRTAT